MRGNLSRIRDPGARMRLQHDYHTHTIHSKHSDPRMTVANSMAAGREAGLASQVVLEHVPEIGSPERRTLDAWYAGAQDRTHLETIAQEIAAAKESAPNVRVYRGVELDADPIKLDGSAMLDDLSGLEIVVGSTHVFPGGEAFWYERLQLPVEKGWRVARTWAKWVERYIRSGKIHILAHPGDLAAANHLIPPFDDVRTKELFDPVLKALADMKVAFELNELLGVKLKEPYRASYVHLVQQAKSYGLKFSIASDAHAPNNVGRFNWVFDLIEAADLGPRDFWAPSK